MPRMTDTAGRPFSGLVSHAVIGVVVDNVDPDSLGRVKVKYPTLPGEPESFWLRQVTPNGGVVGGVYALPEKDDEVLVMFLQGSQDEGVIMGQLWNGQLEPPKEAADGMPGSDKTDTGGQLSTDLFNDGSTDIEKNDRRFWRSRAGHLIVFDDTDGAESIQIWDGDHTLALVFDMKESRILLTNSKGDTHIRTKQDFVFEAGRDIKFRAGRHIEGESVQDTKLVIGQNLSTDAQLETKVKSGTDVKVEAGANVNVKATANVEISGVMVMAKGSAMVKIEGASAVIIQGGTVAIN